MWVRYRYQFAYGDDDWQWHYLGKMNRERAEFFVKEELEYDWKEQYAWSEHSRGVEWFLEEEAPRDVIIKELKAAEQRMHIAAATVSLLTEEISKRKD